MEAPPGRSSPSLRAEHQTIRKDRLNRADAGPVHRGDQMNGRWVVPLLMAGLVLLPLLLLPACGRTEPGIAVSTPVDTALVELSVYNTSVPEPSGLVYNSKNNTLMTVSDANSTVYEIDFAGTILHSTVVQGSDLEGITLSPDCDTMYLAEEGNQQVSTYLINGTKISSLKVPVATEQNHSLEGVTIDNRHHIFVVNEKNPRLLLEFNGATEVARKEITTTLDLSDVSYDAALDCLWIVSDESQKVLKCTKSGKRSLGR